MSMDVSIIKKKVFAKCPTCNHEIYQVYDGDEHFAIDKVMRGLEAHQTVHEIVRSFPELGPLSNHSSL